MLSWIFRLNGQAPPVSDIAENWLSCAWQRWGPDAGESFLRPSLHREGLGRSPLREMKGARRCESAKGNELRSSCAPRCPTTAEGAGARRVQSIAARAAHLGLGSSGLE